MSLSELEKIEAPFTDEQVKYLKDGFTIELIKVQDILDNKFAIQQKVLELEGN